MLSTFFQESVRMSYTQGFPSEQSLDHAQLLFQAGLPKHAEWSVSGGTVGWTYLSIFKEIDIEMEVGRDSGHFTY